MQEYVDSIISTANKLNGIGFNLTDEWLVSILLAGLTDQYKPFIMVIIMVHHGGSIRADSW